MAIKFPQIYLLNTNYEGKLAELQALEREIDVVFNIYEAEVVLGNLTSKLRVPHELRKVGLWTDEVGGNDTKRDKKASDQVVLRPPPRKRRKVSKNAQGKDVINLDSSTESDTETEVEESPTDAAHPSTRGSLTVSDASGDEGGPKKLGGLAGGNDTIKVLNLAWYTDSVKAGELLPQKKYFLYEGKVVERPSKRKAVPSKQAPPSVIFARAKADPTSIPSSFHGHKRVASGSQVNKSQDRTIGLRQETTIEHEYVADLPAIPNYLLPGSYACQRPTPLHSANEAFVAQLRAIKEKKDYYGDIENGHAFASRAYNNCIATLKAYPHTLTSAVELYRLPHCGPRFVALYTEWKETGMIREVEELKSDEKFQALKIFNGIFDVGEKTARQFYDKGWRDIDDVVNYGWDHTLTNTQQMGTKFYYDFQERMSRAEVEKISNHILERAYHLKPGFEMVICGGYRKGKSDCGDVDIVLSHREEDGTLNFLPLLLEDLFKEGSIYRILKKTYTNSERGQNTVAAKGNRPKAGGFDTLDHAFVIWQDQDWDSKAEDLAKNPHARNPNIKRRVDIIISPWKTAGCAILAWSGGTMFERDLRAYCHKELGCKFDSSGVRRDVDGEWMDLEAGDGHMIAKERRLFEGLKLEWRDPTERCTD